MDNWKNLKKTILNNPKVKNTYNDLEVEYQIISSLIELRTQKEITQKELAKKMGTTQSALSRFEMGEINPTLDFLKKMATALETKLSVRFI